MNTCVTSHYGQKRVDLWSVCHSSQREEICSSGTVVCFSYPQVINVLPKFYAINGVKGYLALLGKTGR